LMRGRYSFALEITRLWQKFTAAGELQLCKYYQGMLW
jgi:hypothetical protein